MKEKDINKIIKISDELCKENIIERDFFPDSKDRISLMPASMQRYFNEYLFKQISIPKSKRFISTDHILSDDKDILVLEIGGTKTTIQSFSIKKEGSSRIKPISNIKTIPTLKNEIHGGKISVDNFFKWIADLIKSNLGECKSVGINIATKVDNTGVLIYTPPNIEVEDISGINIIDRLTKLLGNIPIYVFNDVESVSAIQLLKEKESFYTDINGTGNNTSIYSSDHYIQSLETGHVKCIKKQELETAVGGRRGIEKNFNEIAIKNKLVIEPLSAYEIQNIYMQNTNTILSKLAYLTYQRAYLYKAISFICIDKFCKINQINKSDASTFKLFGGINKVIDTQNWLRAYLDLFDSKIQIVYTDFGEDAGRYGCALLTSISL